METADTTKTLPKGQGRVASLSLPVPFFHPLALLRMGKGAPRGFWAREGRWFAHVGQIATVSVDSRSTSPDRYSAVWDDARHILNGARAKGFGGVLPEAPRLFGGFSFREEHRALGVWAGFPSARFVLPEIELVGQEETATLTLRRLVESSADVEEIYSELEMRSQSLLDSMTSVFGTYEIKSVGSPRTEVEAEEADWDRMVRGALHKILQGDLSKVVMARAMTAAFQEEADPAVVAMRLWRENPGAHVFLFEPEEGHALVGAAPETVATVSSDTFQATAVAGSVRLGENAEEQSALAEGLLGSEKDLREHRFCVEDMVARLGPLSEEVEAGAEPHVVTLSAIQHLETPITSRLRVGETVLTALRALHPTPAVCGFPRDRALALLADAEPFSRGWYAGPVGWFDGDGDGVFVPALRSAVGIGMEWRLFAGAGIVAGSDPEKEWAETRMKFQPVLRALSRGKAEASASGSGVLDDEVRAIHRDVGETRE